MNLHVTHTQVCLLCATVKLQFIYDFDLLSTYCFSFSLNSILFSYLMKEMPFYVTYTLIYKFCNKIRVYYFIFMHISMCNLIYILKNLNISFTYYIPWFSVESR
jgi:hypothetical protein